jgi:hypothetical protein
MIIIVFFFFLLFKFEKVRLNKISNFQFNRIRKSKIVCHYKDLIKKNQTLHDYDPDMWCCFIIRYLKKKKKRNEI